MIKIFADTHIKIASNIYDSVYYKYDLKLDKKNLEWWSIAPDILPQYKFIRHYKDESLEYIVREIIKVIYISRYIEFNRVLDPISIKILSKKIGLISHYISDYFCLPHARRWTFKENMVKHLKYESELDKYVKNFDFENNLVGEVRLNLYEDDIKYLESRIKGFIEDSLNLYFENIEGYKNDLSYAYTVNLELTYFILDMINEYSEEIYRNFAFEL